MTTIQNVDVLMIGAGPSNIALAIGIEERQNTQPFGRVVMLEKDATTNWHKNMLFPEAQSQVSFLKDLVTLRDPTSKFSFLNFLHKTGRLEAFVNLQSFFPYRREMSSYLQWVVTMLEKVHVQYSAEVKSIAPILNAEKNIEGWLVTTARGDIFKAKRLFYGAGREANLPPQFENLNSNRVFHSSAFLSKVKPFQTAAVANIAVIGGAQSSAEIYQACLEMFPQSRISMLMRSIGLMNYGGSKFVNTIYQNDYVDVFYNTSAAAKKEVLDNMHMTNYAGVAPGTMEALYRFHYLQDLTGGNRAQMLTQCEVVAVDVLDTGVQLTWRNKLKNVQESAVFDFVVLGTGYRNCIPSLFAPTLALLAQQDFAVSRCYRAAIPCATGVSLHLQGVNEGTHGIADTLLSVLAHRTNEILDDLATETQRLPAPLAAAHCPQAAAHAAQEMALG